MTDCYRRAAETASLLALVLTSLLVHGAEPAQEPEGWRPVLVGAVTVYAVRPGERHIVPPAFEEGALVINVPQRMLFHRGDADRIDAYPVAVGRRGWRTPTGEFVVVTKEREPTWDVPASILEESLRQGRTLPAKVPPGPNNPLGAFWIGLSLPGIGIHGTNAPSSISKAATHGCIRMHPDDIARLFPSISIGTRGRSIYEPVLLAAQDGVVYLEVHPDIYRRTRGTVGDAVRAAARATGLSERIDWGAADAVAAARDGIARDVTLKVEKWRSGEVEK